MINLPRRPHYGEDITEDERSRLRREGADKAMFYAQTVVARLPVRDPQPGETPAEWMGAWRALVEAQLDLTARQIERGELSLVPLPKRRTAHG